MHNFDKYDIILASQSPRRQQLLGDLGISFRASTQGGVDETYPETIKGISIAEYLAKLKANAFTNELKESSILITADTIVLLNDLVLGKPSDKQEAMQVLGKLSGKKHQVATGVCLKSLEKEISFVSVTDVYFDELSADEIEYYVDNFAPYDKAGAYGIQEWIGYIGVKRIEGSYFNVMGLPVQELYKKLVHFIEN